LGEAIERGAKLLGSRAIHAHEKCGFIVEGREREAAVVNGAWHDDVMMGLLDYAFLAQKF
jgi:RimJ/RimL family protein N-acetyltransferase